MWLFFSREKFIVQFSVPRFAVGLVMDIYILILPIVAVSTLQMPPRRKVGIILIFTTGLLQVRIPPVHHNTPGTDARLAEVALVWGQS